MSIIAETRSIITTKTTATIIVTIDTEDQIITENELRNPIIF